MSGRTTAGLIAEVHARLAQAGDEGGIIAAVSHFAERSGALAMHFMYVHSNDQGSPSELQGVASWWRSRDKSEPIFGGQRVPISKLSLTPLWMSRPSEPLILENTQTDPRVDDDFKRLSASLDDHSIIVLPLYSRGQKRWLGVFFLTWATPHTPSEEERFIYHVLTQSLVAFVANRRAVLAQQEMLSEVLALNAMSARLSSATTLDEALRAALGWAIDQGAFGASLSLIQTEASGRPARIQIVAEWTRVERPTGSLGQHFDLSDVQMSRHWIEDPDSPLLIEDVRTDPRVDAAARTLYDTFQIGASATLPLRNRAHWVGLLMISWPAPHSFTEQDHRIYRSIMNQAAVVVHNRLLFAKMQEALAERSTPLIPISDEIMVMPLIGSLDPERGQQIVDVLLTGVSASRARIAIIDITGVRTLDTAAANALTGAAQALRLLGVEPVLTGIRAEVAQTLVNLGVPLAGIVTLSTLQSGIAYANRARKR